MTWLQRIAIDQVPPLPWRNGGGSTRELFTWPGGSAPWQLRISLADITQDGPFSAFDGVDRWFAVLQGAGVRLALPGGVQTLDAGSPPLQFDGAAAPGCWLVDGPTRDLNLMVQRGAGQAGLLAAAPRQPWVHGAPLRGLLTTTPVQLQIDDTPPCSVGAWTLALAGAASGKRWTITTPGDSLPTGQRACWLAFTPNR
ncbi:MAG: HutD family protein [Aquabacterium sp.]|nr:HutD family protein [Aquabacterium sp.]